MRNIIRSKPVLTLFFSFFILNVLSAQTENSSSVLPLAIILIIGILILAVVFLVADNFMQTSLGGSYASSSRDSFFPSLTKWTKPKPPPYVDKEAHFVELKDGFDILLVGQAEEVLLESPRVTRFAVQPKNFRGIAPIPKMEVEIGGEVKAGDALFHDKKAEAIKYVAPVSGEVVAINRGAKRAITEVVILADKEIKFRELPGFDFNQSDRPSFVQYLQSAGFWPMIKERPFDVVPSSDSVPENIFISTFDTGPLAPNQNYIIEGNEALFHKGLEGLTKLTSGQVHLGLSGNGEQPHEAFVNAPYSQKHWFKGPHPAGNVGVQIHHIDSIGRGEKVWTLEVQDVILLGQILLNRKFDTSRKIALTGSISKPAYIQTFLGANVGELLKSEKLENVRIVSGDVLSGKFKVGDSFLNNWDNQLTVIEEGNQYELFGWLVPSSPRPSVSKTYPNFLFKDLKFAPNTNTHGERRAFVVTDQYEKLLPMDIYPQHLMKAIISNDFEQMEGLGIYELSEEDVALCEFACTSKMPLQKILREGLELMQEQG